MSTVLSVDDSATDRRLAGGLLEQGGEFTVCYAVDGHDALTQMELHVPELVITDLNMPDMGGLQLTTLIRQTYPFVPVILMTARGSEEIAVEALRKGAASYVLKRRLAQELLETVRQVVSFAKEDRGQIRLLRRMLKQEVEFSIENESDLISSLVKYLQNSAASRGICDETTRVRIGVALQEAMTNACYHGNLEVSSELREVDHRAFYELIQQRSNSSPYAERRIHVRARLTPDSVEYIIRDEGPGFDPTTLPDPRDPQNLERPSGRGLLLMQTFMDEVRYNATGNEVLLIKRRTPATPKQNGDAA
jgi:CheY-like chemotaxis protein/anti-sigma regulatory factor (Ser/Thr protein kinase)